MPYADKEQGKVYQKAYDLRRQRTPNVTYSCAVCGVIVSKYVPPCMLERRKRRYCQKHHGYRENVLPQAGRLRAERLYPSQPCSRCGVAKAERHHCDGNPLNNAPSNIRFLCRHCHMAEDGRLSGKLKGIPKKSRKTQ